jgi:hypothetical protein
MFGDARQRTRKLARAESPNLVISRRHAAILQNAPQNSNRLAIAPAILECGGKRSATPLSPGLWLSIVRSRFARTKAPSPLSLCRRISKNAGAGLQISNQTQNSSGWL